MGLLYRFLLAIPSKGQIRGGFGHHCNPDSILLHLYIKNIVSSDEVTAFKENSSHFQKESSQNLTSTMKEYIFVILLVIELCVFPMERACIRGYFFIFERGLYWYISRWSHCKGACTLYCVLLIVCFFSRSLPPRHQLGQKSGMWLVLVSFSGEVWGRLHGLTVCWWVQPLFLGHPVRQTVSYSLKVHGALGCFVQDSRLVQGGVMLFSDSHARLMVSGRQFWKTAPAGWSRAPGTGWWWSPAHCWWWSLSASGWGCQWLWWAWVSWHNAQ